MRNDVYEALQLKEPKKIPHKETLNNYELFSHYAGFDARLDYQKAYIETIKRTGVDFVGKFPAKNAQIWTDKNLMKTVQNGRQTMVISYLGADPTSAVTDYGFKTPEDVIEYDPFSEYMTTFEKLFAEYKKNHDEPNAALGDYAQYYFLYYTTLFMWPVILFGWELFMETAMIYPEEFEILLDKFTTLSEMHMKALASLDYPFIMIHDDITMANGPVFAPSWYEQYIFPRYKKLFEPIRKMGKKIIFTSDGKLDAFIDDLIDCGVDGFMVETPATDFDSLIKKCGKDKVIIGGADTRIVTFGTPNEVYEHTKEVLLKGRECPGFFLSSPGGFHGNVPLANSIAFFEAAEKYGKR